MRRLLLGNTSLLLFLMVSFAGLPLTLALGDEAHRAECNETAVNALKADIQAMGEGQAFAIISHFHFLPCMPPPLMKTKSDFQRFRSLPAQYLDCSTRQWHAMVALGLHAAGWDCPDSSVHIYLVITRYCADRLRSPHGGQDREFKATRRHAVAASPSAATKAGRSA